MDDVPDTATARDPGLPSGLQRLAAAVEREIVPRLLVASRVGPFSPELLASAGHTLDATRIEELLRLLRGPSEFAAEGYLRELLDRGVTLDAVCMDLLGPAARRLGTMWEEDECDFVEVTIAVGRMQRVLHSLGSLFAGTPVDSVSPTGRLYLTCIPGEQHTLGILVVAEFFLRDGWAVDLGHPLDAVDLRAAVRENWFDVVGFSVACDSNLARLRREVRSVRQASRNADVRVMVGGRPFVERPDLVRRTGADATAADAREAPGVAAALL